jgi:hypothetical protein
MKPPAWMELEIEQEFFADLASKLKAGAALSQVESAVLLKLINERPAPKRQRGRPTDELEPWGPTWRLGMACIWREAKGEPVKVAVADVARDKGVSHRTVFAARAKVKALCR